MRYSYHVVTAELSRQRRLDGVIVEGGNATGQSYVDDGGGVYNQSPGKLLIENAVIRNNTADVFFTHLGANSDRADHVRLLGDNTFGFEDTAGGGDQDFDDLIVKVSFA